MSKKLKKYICTNCGAKALKWVGVCSGCQEWNSYKLESLENLEHEKVAFKVKKFSEITERDSSTFLKSGDQNIDTVFGSGIVTGSITLLSGEPGVGKSTFLLKLMNLVVSNNPSVKVLYASGEESLAQISLRANRLGVINERINAMNTNSWQELVEVVCQKSFDFVIIDSIQTLRDEELNSTQGSSTQIKGITSELLKHFKVRGITAIIVGHKTKDGSIAGPKLLEHMVDVVMNFTSIEDDLRVLKAKKNRFGPTDVAGLFEMNENGLESVDIQEMEQLPRKNDVGSGYFTTRKHGKPVFLQLQSIAIENKFGPGKRVCQGIDQSRLSLLLAVIEKVLKLPLSNYDIYFKASWGEKLQAKEADLAIVSCILSSYFDKELPSKSIFSGEINLSGTISKNKRLKNQLGNLKANLIQLDHLEELNGFFKDKAS